jgi:hypothetical protein
MNEYRKDTAALIFGAVLLGAVAALARVWDAAAAGLGLAVLAGAAGVITERAC